MASLFRPRAAAPAAVPPPPAQPVAPRYGRAPRAGWQPTRQPIQYTEAELLAVEAELAALEQSGAIERAATAPEARPARGASSARISRPAGVLIGGLGMLVSAVFWIIGGRFTIDGVLVWANMLLDFLSSPVRVPTPATSTIYAWLSPIVFACSAVEWAAPPLRRHKGRVRLAPLPLILLWLIVAGADVASTYTGLGVLPAQPTPLRAGFAGSMVPRGAVAGALTFLPEWCFKYFRRLCWQSLWGRG